MNEWGFPEIQIPNKEDDPQEINDVNRRDYPHHATITFKIDVRRLNMDGTLDRWVMGRETLSKYNMSNKAQIVVTGVDEADCIKNIKAKLERLNE